jgi:hypothetical protein
MAFLAIHWHCTCGAPDFKAQLRKGPVLERAKRACQHLHTGPGHAPRPDVLPKAIDDAIEELRALMEAAGVSRPPA